MTVRIHINRAVIARNVKTGSDEPAIIVRRGKRREYGHDVEIIGPARIVQRIHAPMDCGARVWIEAADARVVQKEPQP